MFPEIFANFCVYVLAHNTLQHLLFLFLFLTHFLEELSKIFPTSVQYVARWMQGSQIGYTLLFIMNIIMCSTCCAPFHRMHNHHRSFGPLWKKLSFKKLVSFYFIFFSYFFFNFSLVHYEFFLFYFHSFSILFLFLILFWFFILFLLF